MDWPFEGLEPGRYGAITADPPWAYKNWGRSESGKGAQDHYACQPLDWIKQLPVAELAAKDCALFLWATAPLLPAAFEVMAAWGFEYKSAGAWAKQSKTGAKWAFGTGYCFRSATEFYLLGTRGAPRVQSRSVRNLTVAPVREHSRKPDCFRTDVETLYAGPYLELFARQSAPGWDAWGNEATKFDSPSAARKQALRESVL